MRVRVFPSSHSVLVVVGVFGLSESNEYPSIIDGLSSLAVGPPPAALAQDGNAAKQSTTKEAPGSPALSTTSTAEGGSSPVLPPLPTPTINGKILDLLKTPPPPSEARTHSRNSSRYFTASWGSPYPESSDAASLVTAHSRRNTFSSEASGDSPLRGLALHTPYLRPAPTFPRTQTQPPIVHQSGISAAVLVNRARRPTRGLTEDWIRAHTDPDLATERLNWLSDSNDLESEDSSESGDWIEDNLDPKTPTLKTFVERRSSAGSRPEHVRQSSNETLKQVVFQEDNPQAKMSTNGDSVAVDPLGEMTIGRKSSARKLVQHTRAPSSAESIKQNPFQNGSPEVLVKTMSNISSTDRSSFAESTASHAEGAEIRSEPAATDLDKELPPPPPEVSEEKSLEVPEWRAASLPASIEVRPEVSETLSATSPALPARLKRKIAWHNKQITILLPLDDERGKKDKAPFPMAPSDAERMLRDWEQLGYNVTGFNLGDADVLDLVEIQGQSRSVWPIPEVMQEEREMRKFKVNIPDRRQWDAYCQELAEAKLRALGVTLGDEEPVSTISPAAANMSLTASLQYPPLPYSPPVPTSSSTSSHPLHHPNPFSPALMAAAGPSTSQSSNHGSHGSVASPASMHAQIYGKYNPRQSISLATGDRPYGSPFQYGPVQSPGVWPPQQMLYQPGLARGGSPSLHNMGAIISPASPFAQDGYFQPADFAQMQLRKQQLEFHKQHLENQLQQQGMQQVPFARPASGFQELREENELDIAQKSPSKTPEASQYIRHNASNSLQKEIDEAEYHLVGQMQRELEGEDYSPHSEKEESSSAFGDLPAVPDAPIAQSMRGLNASRYAESDGPILHHPQPHSRGHSLSQRPFIDSEDVTSPALDIFAQPVKQETPEIDTNPSAMDTPVLSNDFSGMSRGRSFSNESNPWLDSEAPPAEPFEAKRGHSAKPSVSKLNVEAAEFKFNPASSFQPGNYSFESGIFQPAIVVNPTAVPSTTQSNKPMNGSVGAGKSLISKINVAAPVFTPGQSEFSFSSSGPTFRPDAPAFVPTSAVTDSVTSGQSGTEGSDSRKSIFGEIDILGLTGIVKPPKKNKAVPIIRPDSAEKIQTIENEYKDGPDGRIMQGEGRNKRVRNAGTDGDSVPLFAEPSPEPMPLQETTRDQSPPKEVTLIVPTKADKENLPVEVERDALRVASPPATKALRPHSMFENSPDYDGKGWAPWELQQEQQRQDFSTASAYPVKSPRLSEAKDQNGHADKENEEPKSAVSATSDLVVDKPKGHKKNSLSALAKPFEFSTPSWLKFGVSSTAPKQQPVPAPTASPVPAPAPVPTANVGLSSSRYASSPQPPLTQPIEPFETPESPEVRMDTPEKTSFQSSLPGPESPPPFLEETEVVGDREPTFEEIDAVMRHMNEAESERVISRDADTPRWRQPSPARGLQMPEDAMSSPVRMQPQNLLRSDAPSPSPRRFQPLPGDRPGQRVFSRVHDDPYVNDQIQSLVGLAYESPVHNLNTEDPLPQSDWDSVVGMGEEEKFQARTQFFDGHVTDLVGGLLAERLDPVEKALDAIQSSLAVMSTRTPSSRRDRRSVSGELQESDADDEDDEHQRSTSPRKDRKMEKIRSIVTEALAAHQPTPAAIPSTSVTNEDSSHLLQVLEDMREQFGQSMRLDLRGEDLRNIVEEAVERRMPSPKAIVDDGATTKVAELEARILELIQKAQAADQKTEEEIKTRRAAEDRLAEVQRLLRISSEEEDRLRETLEEKQQKLKNIDDTRSKSTMRTALLEANAQNAQKNQTELSNKLNIIESDLRQARHDTQHWQLEAEKALEAAKRHNEDAETANDKNAQLRRAMESLKLQMEEGLRTREVMRVKLGGLQEEMARAARDISQENAKRAKKEQGLTARQEVLDARLQAEARTRERLEREIERLENGEREGMRAVNESKKLEELLGTLRNELHEAEKKAMRYQREFEEARESGLSEVQRTRHYMQAEIEAANNQVNIVRQDLEDQISRLRTDLEQTKLDADTTKARSEMLLEEAVETKRKDIENLTRKHENEIEDLQTRHERDLGNTIEGHQRSEQHLLERLSLSSAKMEHLQDRVTHLEERLEIAKTAALAAAQAARSAGVLSPDAPVKASQRVIAKGMELPEKISPQALRESIMVLQEQLQDREQTIEKLEQKLSTVDLDAPIKISKRDDEITWLRELLAVRVGDLQDIINTVSEDDFDAAAVKDAAIRLKANLQMEMQERERAMSGASILPNIASSIRDAATPRVAQVVGPMAAAWGNWRKSQETGSTPSKASPQSFLSGLLTPPASSIRTPPAQPTAFSSTGRRFTGQQIASRPSRRQEKMPAKEGPPSTPPMMRKASYDSDARAEDFSDAGFYDDDEGAVDDSMFGAGRL